MPLGYLGAEEQRCAHRRPAAADVSLAFPFAGLADEGDEASQGADLLATERAEFGQVGDHGAGDDRADTGTEASRSSFSRHTGEPRTVSSMSWSMSASSRFRATRSRSMLLRTRGISVRRSRWLSDAIISTIGDAAQQICEHAGRLVRQRPHHWLGGFGKAGDHPRVDRICLGPLAQRLGKGSDLGGVDHDQGKARTRQAGGDDVLVAAGRLERHYTTHAGQAATQLGKAIRIAADRPRFIGWQDVNVQPILRDIDPDDGGVFHGDPSLLKRARDAAPATVRVHRNDGGATMLRNGLERPRVRRSPLRHRAAYSTPAGRR